jgi:hypothetical protein
MTGTWKRRNRPKKISTLPPKVYRPRCTEMTSGDEHYCGCGVRWQLGEDRPECPRKNEK